MSTWKRGRELVVERLNATEVSLDDVLQAARRRRRRCACPAPAVFMTARPEGAPPILVHHLKHNKVLHEQIVLLTVSMLNTPTISEGEPIEVQALGGGFYRVIARFGFMESPDVPIALGAGAREGAALERRGHDLLPRRPHAAGQRPDRHVALARHDLHLPVAQRAAGHQFLQYSRRSRRRNRYSARDLGARMALPLGGV